MKEKLKERISDVGEKLGWQVSFTEEKKNLTIVEFEKDVLGMDYVFSVLASDNDPEYFMQDMQDHFEGFDFEEEASKWIGPDGHGVNGAPYHISDILKATMEVDKQLRRLLRAYKNVEAKMAGVTTYKIPVEVTEFLQKTIMVEAVDEEDAIRIVEAMIDREEIVLSDNDFKKRDFTILND